MATNEAAAVMAFNRFGLGARPGGLAEADLVLGLRAGRQALLGAAEDMASAAITGLYE